MINLLIPAVAVLFSLVVSILYDVMKDHRLDYQKLLTQVPRAAMYLAAIGMLEIVAKSEPALAPHILQLALAFGLAEIVGTLGIIKQAATMTNSGVPADQAAQTVIQKAVDQVGTLDPFSMLNDQQAGAVQNAQQSRVNNPPGK